MQEVALGPCLLDTVLKWNCNFSVAFQLFTTTVAVVPSVTEHFKIKVSKRKFLEMSCSISRKTATYSKSHKKGCSQQVYSCTSKSTTVTKADKELFVLLSLFSLSELLTPNRYVLHPLLGQQSHFKHFTNTVGTNKCVYSPFSMQLFLAQEIQKSQHLPLTWHEN